jgi:hypothetical protein
MRRAMIHPYYGHTVECAQHNGEQHEHFTGWAETVLEPCEDCGDVLATCRKCMAVTACCSCGNYHSIDCPWPL